MKHPLHAFAVPRIGHLLALFLFPSAAIVWELLGMGANPAPVAANGWTPLLAAALSGHASIVRQLIGAGASYTAATLKGWNALHMACHVGHAGQNAAAPPIPLSL